MEDHNVSGRWYKESLLDTWVDSPRFWLLWEIFLPILVNGCVDYPEPDGNDISREMLFLEQERPENDISSTYPRHKAVLFCPLSSNVGHLKWWLTKYFADHVDILHKYAEMGNDEHTVMQLKSQDSQNVSIFVGTPKVGRTSLNLTAAIHAIMTNKFRVLNEQWQAFVLLVQLRLNREPHTCVLNTGPAGYGYDVTDLHQHATVVQMRDLQHLMSQLYTTLSMIYPILTFCKDHMKRQPGNKDTLLSDDPSSWIVQNALSRYASFDIQPTWSSWLIQIVNKVIFNAYYVA